MVEKESLGPLLTRSLFTDTPFKNLLKIWSRRFQRCTLSKKISNRPLPLASEKKTPPP